MTAEPPAIDRPSAAQIDESVVRSFGSRFEPLGFERVTDRKWVRSAGAPIRELVVVQALKGASYSPYWGISIDFVPHLAGTSFRWHRTDRSALADLRVDPLDSPKRGLARDVVVEVPLGGVSRSGRRSGRSPVSFERAADVAHRHATAWFERVDGVASLPDLFRRAERARSTRFGFDHYVQHRLALAFVLVALGSEEEGQRELATWLARHGDRLGHRQQDDLERRLGLARDWGARERM